jgi:dihydroorotate dehydrogenase
VYQLLRPLLFALPPSTAHALGMAALALPERATWARSQLERGFAHHNASLEVVTMGLRFPNPIGVAGGFDKNGRRARSLAALGFGHIELGTVTAHPQAANPAPNLFRLPDDRALINRLGFPNEGAAALASRLARVGRPAVPVGISIGKSRIIDTSDQGAVIADYLVSYRAVRAVADFVVVNVSSPNTPNLRAMQRADSASVLLRALVDAGRELASPPPLLLKVAPDLDDDAYDALLAVIADVGLAGVVAANTTIARMGLKTDPARIEAIGAGGLSGAPVHIRALSMVARARARLGPTKTIIGVGGIFDADDAHAMLEVGADLCQSYTGFIYQGPRFARAVCEGLAAGERSRHRDRLGDSGRGILTGRRAQRRFLASCSRGSMCLRRIALPKALQGCTSCDSCATSQRRHIRARTGKACLAYSRPGPGLGTSSSDGPPACT